MSCCEESQRAVHKLHEEKPSVEHKGWANLPQELLQDVVKRLEDTWPSDKHVFACAGVCRTWRKMCKEIVGSPEFCGKLTFPISLKQPGPRDCTTQCFIKRDKLKLAYHLYLSLNPDVCGQNGKFLLSAKRTLSIFYKEYIISTATDRTSRSSNNCLGKLRSDFRGREFTLHEMQPPHSSAVGPTEAEITYLRLGKGGPRGMICRMHSTPSSALENVSSRTLGDSFSSASFSKPSASQLSCFEAMAKKGPLVLRTKDPRFNWDIEAWVLNFHGRVKVASVKNFQLIDATARVPVSAKREELEKERAERENKVLLQFGRVSKDIFTMDYRYPLSAFQAFAICLTTFDTKLGID